MELFAKCCELNNTHSLATYCGEPLFYSSSRSDGTGGGFAIGLGSKMIEFDQLLISWFLDRQSSHAYLTTWNMH